MRLYVYFHFDSHCNIFGCPLLSFYWGKNKEHWSRGFFLPTEEDCLSILTKLNEEKGPNSEAIEEHL